VGLGYQYIKIWEENLKKLFFGVEILDYFFSFILNTTNKINNRFKE
jgi:hypothetical protein